MKKINLRRIIVLLGLFVLLFLVSRFTNIFGGLGYPPFTTFSSGKEGVSLVYDTLRVMGYPVGRDIMFLSAERPVNNVQFVIAPWYFDDELREGMIDWVVRGGQLMFFEYGRWQGNSLLSGVVPNNYIHIEGGTLYRIGFGTLFVGDASKITNISLFENNGEYGQLVVDILNTMEFRRIYFNEAYHGYNLSRSFFDILPQPLRLMGVQLALAGIVCVIYMGKRFGKPSPYYEEVEREENEYVFTLSNLYMSIGLGNAALSVYDRKLKKCAADYFRTLAEPDFHDIHALWKDEDKRHLGKLEYIIENREREFNIKRRKERGEFLKMAACYRDLIKELRS